MPGHGERFIETYEDWFVRINKRVQRLERRIARLATITEPEPSLIDGTGYSGSVYAMKVNGVVQVWTGSQVSLTSGSLPTGTTVLMGLGVVPADFRPRLGTQNRFGPMYMSGGHAGLALVSPEGGLQLFNQSGAARSGFQFTITFIP